MFRDFVNGNQWKNYITLTQLFPYKSLQEKIIESYRQYQNLFSQYSKKVGRDIHPLEIQYLSEHPDITMQNISLLRNAIQLWKDASQTSEAIAPVLYHYCFHCFISFLNYTFFRWKPKHAKSHGVSISKWSENISDIEIRISKRDGIFQRFIDTWALLGTSVAFSPFLPIHEEGNIKYIRNNHYILQNSDSLTIRELMDFKPRQFENIILEEFPNEWIKCHFIGSSSIMQINNNLKNYLILFIASSVARYRPIIWENILVGKTPEHSDFSRESTRALVDLSTNNLLRNVNDLFQNIINSYFAITH